MSTPAPRAVLYVRLSQTDDASTSVVRQSADLHALADREGWTVVRELTDDGISGRKTRANADEALRMLREGEADVLAVFKFDRWSRQGLGAVASLVAVLDERPEASFVALHDGLRSSQPAWRIIASVLAEVARMEAENTGTRVRSSQAHLLTTGRFRGYTVPFGYRSIDNPDGAGRVLVLDEVEAPLVRSIAARVLDGTSLTAITRELREARVPTGKSDARKARQAGKPWEALERGTWHLSAIRTLLRSDTLLGRTTTLRDGVRVPVTDEHGLPVTFWTPVVDAGTLALLRERLPLGRSLGPRRAARLLSGIAYCGICGSKCYVVASGGATFYKCSARSFEMDAPCPAPRMKAEPLEEYITERFLGVCGDWPETVEVRSVSNPEAEAELATVDSALQEATTALMGDHGDPAALFARIQALKAKRQELRDLPTSVTIEERPTGRTMREAWDLSDGDDVLRKRRELILRVLDHVDVLPLTPGGKLAPAERTRLAWYS